MGRRDGLCACGLVACICFGLTGELIESGHPHHDDPRPSIIASADPRHPDHAHEEHGGFVTLGEDRSGVGSGGNVVITPPTGTLQIDTAAPTVE